MKILIAGVAGGVLMFIWGFVSHELLPIGTTGFKFAPTSVATVAAVKAAFPEEGIYMVPGPEGDPKDEKVREAWMAAASKGPYAFVVSQPGGTPEGMAGQLLIECGSNVLAALFAALLLARASIPSFSGRLLFVTAVGVAAWFSSNVSEWIWYRFPTNYTLAQLVDQAGGFFCAGLAVAALVKPKSM